MLSKKTKYFLSLLLFPLLSLIYLPSCAYYLLNQTQGQIHILLHRQPLAPLWKRKNFSKHKKKIQILRKLRHFATATLGMPTQGYRYFFDTQGRAVAWNISAAPKLELTPIQWWFPIVGEVPYLGFFTKEEAIAAKYQLAQAGYDVLMREVAAYSTLGWFDDPIFSPMLENDIPVLVETTLHEIAHTHIYIPSHGNFNENIATFIGEEGTKIFLKREFGKTSPLYREYLTILKDREKLDDFIQQYYQQLDQLYHSSLPRKEKLQQRKKIFLDMTKEFSRIRKKFQSQNYRYFLQIGWNNAVILSLRRYRGSQRTLRQALKKHHHNLKRFIHYLKKLSEMEHPLQRLKEFVRQN
ncbi:MAG: hypothetical protein D6805_06790 [Planctomycetota bacterium]|nr:MAG: hypothetical protein D6805_06790 [Planctomycetota bacterium]